MADSTGLRRINTELVRSAFQNGRAWSKNDLARETGLSFPTVSRTVDQLVQLGEIEAAGAAASTGGRCAQRFVRNARFRVMLCASLTDGKLRYSMYDLDGAAIENGEVPAEQDAAVMLDTLAAGVRQQYPQLGALVLGVDCAVHDGVIDAQAVYPTLRGVDLASRLRAACGAPCAVLRDVHLAAEGCCLRTQAAGQTVVCIHLGASGMRASLAVDGRAFEGAACFAGALHYLPIKNNLEYAQNGFAGADMTAYYMQVIRAYAALVNPHRVVLYDNPLLEGRLARIRHACAQTLPAQAVPEIVCSQDFETDYQAGLCRRAAELTEESIHELLYL